MMRTNLQPLAHLVDMAAEKWLAVAESPGEQQLPVLQEISASFNIGDLPELTFHGLRYQLLMRRDTAAPDGTEALSIEVHEIAIEG